MIPITNCKRDLKYPYFITSTGKVYSEKCGRFLDTVFDKDGYEKVRLVSADGKRHRYSVHRLVLENFNPILHMDVMQVNHIDGNKANNNITNLEWCTCKENIKHATQNKLRHNQCGENNNGSKVSEQDILDMIDLYINKKMTGVEISRLYGLSDDFFGTIKRKQNWKHLTKNIDFYNRRFND